MLSEAHDVDDGMAVEKFKYRRSKESYHSKSSVQSFSYTLKVNQYYEIPLMRTTHQRSLQVVYPDFRPNSVQHSEFLYGKYHQHLNTYNQISNNNLKSDSQLKWN